MSSSNTSRVLSHLKGSLMQTPQKYFPTANLSDPSLWAHVRRVTTVVARGRRIRQADRCRRCWRRCPWQRGEVKEVQQVGLRSIASRKMRVRSDESIFNKLDNRSVIHRNMRDVVFAREGRNNHVRHPESKLRAKSIYRCSIRCDGAGFIRF